MTACKALLFRSALVAILVHAVGGNEFRTAPSKSNDGYAAAAAGRARALEEEEAAPGLLASSRAVAADRSRGFEAEADVSTGPDPFFADLEFDVARQDDKEFREPPKKLLLHKVEVYEVESGGLGRRWRQSRAGWTYKDGSSALPPRQVLCPDEWTWASEWKIDGSGGRDEGGWEYSKSLMKFNSVREPRGRRLADRFRRRRWVRAMQCVRPQREQQQEDLNEVGGLQLESPPDTTGMAFPAGTYEFGAEDFRFDLGREDVDLFPAPDIYERGTYRARKPLKLPELGHALTACKGWWAEEFTFRGFGIGFVKPVFRGLLLRPDLGVGVRLPVTLHFRSWESREALPSVALSLFVLWPPAVQVSQAMSYPAELLQELATTAARKIMVPSKEAMQVRRRKEAVQRLGVSIGVRYSSTYGFQWWLAPYFFLLPGVRVLWTLYQSMMTLLLSSLALMQRSDASGFDRENGRTENQEALWVVALRSWAAEKTSGLGYSLYLSGNRLGGAAYVNFMPFFLPTFSRAATSAGNSSGVTEPGAEQHEQGVDEVAAPVQEDPGTREAASSDVAVGVSPDGCGAESNATEAGQQRQGAVLQPISA
ncbi:unnamed protein product [Ectocarpus fasciculatus]